MSIFKKKLTEMEAPSVLAEIVKVIIANTALDPSSLIKEWISIPLPMPALPVNKEKIAETLAKAIVVGIPKEKALEIVKEIKEQLKDYKT